MINYEKFELENGLRVIFHEDKTTPLAVVNILYDVGARDESEEKTGFAHLFEHLMFGGSKNIENFDAPLQLAGGECNAFTSNDITNYYNTVPAQNLETAFWLESDRMLELAFTPKSLEVQRNVVVEEFKQRYLNQPYGDVWLELRPLIYKEHPYKWPTIGKKIEHIQDAVMEDVKSFFYSFYGPQNAILVVAGNTSLEKVRRLAEKYFGDIPERKRPTRNIPVEPEQNEYREKLIKREVPSNAVYMAFRMGKRASRDYYLGDLTSDILGNGKSSRLYDKLVNQEKKFSTISAYITGAMEDGLLVISGRPNDDISFDAAKESIRNVIDELLSAEIGDKELTKVKNKFKTAKVFGEQSLVNRAMNLAFFEELDMLSEMDQEINKYDSISSVELLDFAKKTFRHENTSTLLIQKSNG
ncbi:MAG: insulinase family protein [Crocinitomicaceae bacterium]|nr:insulinase family protein [Crocinitomicaceae bacterium]